MEIKPEGFKSGPRYSSLLNRLKKKKQPVQTEPEPAKKDAKKKDDKKPVEQTEEKV